MEFLNVLNCSIGMRWISDCFVCFILFFGCDVNVVDFLGIFGRELGLSVFCFFNILCLLLFVIVCYCLLKVYLNLLYDYLWSYLVIDYLIYCGISFNI